MTRNLTLIGQAEIRPTRQPYWLFILLGGLLIGLAASLPLAVVWPYPNPPPESVCIFGGEKIRLGGVTLPFHCIATFMFVKPLVWCSFLSAGGLFGLLAHKLSSQGSRILVALVGSLSFLLASFIGGQVVDTLPNADIPSPFPDMPILFFASTAIPFAIMSFGVSLAFALAIGLGLRTRGLLWRALVAAIVTAICYWLVAWILLGHAVMLFSHDPTTPPLADSLPELGRPMGPMMKTTLISNLIAGTIGGSTILFLFTVPSRTVPRPSARTGTE